MADTRVSLVSQEPFVLLCRATIIVPPSARAHQQTTRTVKKHNQKKPSNLKQNIRPFFQFEETDPSRYKETGPVARAHPLTLAFSFWFLSVPPLITTRQTSTGVIQRLGARSGGGGVAAKTCSQISEGEFQLRPLEGMKIHHPRH